MEEELGPACGPLTDHVYAEAEAGSGSSGRRKASSPPNPSGPRDDQHPPGGCGSVFRRRSGRPCPVGRRGGAGRVRRLLPVGPHHLGQRRSRPADRGPVGGALGHRRADPAAGDRSHDHTRPTAQAVGAGTPDGHARPAGGGQDRIRRRPRLARARRLRPVRRPSRRPDQGGDAGRGTRPDRPPVDEARSPSSTASTTTFGPVRFHPHPRARREDLPVRVGGVLPSLAGMRRAARWDRAVPIRYRDNALVRPTAEDVASVRDLVREPAEFDRRFRSGGVGRGRRHPGVAGRGTPGLRGGRRDLVGIGTTRPPRPDWYERLLRRMVRAGRPVRRA